MRRILSLAAVAVCVIVLPSAAQAQTARVYLLPLSTACGNTPALKAKYLPCLGISGVETKPMGAEPVALACAVVTPAQHASVALNIDVLAIPEDLDSPITIAGLALLKLRFESAMIPLADLTPASTWRQAVRRAAQIAGLYQRLQGFVAEQGEDVSESFFRDGLSLDNNLIDAVRRVFLVNAAQSLGLNTEGVRNTAPIRDVLILLSGQLTAPITLCNGAIVL